MYYDKYGRVVQTRATNHLGGYDLVYNELKFTGAPIRNLKTHSINGTTPSITELYTYDYNKAQQPTTTTYSLNGGSAITFASNSYDELGRLTSKTRHSNTDTESYAYNIRNWLTNITSGSFQENLYYNTNPLSSNVTFNGNISYSTWTYNGAAKGYLYSYDGLNRLLSSSFKQGSSGLGDGSFDETFTYDKMGNILTLARKKNNTLIDDLAYHYSNNEKSNQLQYVNDGGITQNQYLVKEYQNKSDTLVEFAYDANGNMIKDLDREIYTIKYNVLNLPDVVQFKNGNQIKNTYNAGGQKLGTEYFTWLPGANAPVVNTGDVLNLSYLQNSVDQNGTVYIGNIEYNTQNGNSALTTLSRIYNTEGYVENTNNPQYYYYRKDHLGNNCEVWLANTDSTVQRTQYYTSGLPMTYNDGDNPGQQRMKYNGKEFDEMHGVDVTNLGSRGLHNAKGRFDTMDRFAEKYPWQSPYVFAGNNPVSHVDVNGDSTAILNMGSGTDQHMAMLIQDKNRKWHYYSLNGVPIFKATNGYFGGGDTDDVGKKEFNSPEEFIQSAFNTRATSTEEKKDKDKIDGYGFTEAYVLPTTQEQDTKIRTTFLNAINDGYSLINNQCSQAVQKSLNSAGVETRLTEINAYNAAKIGTPLVTKYNPYLPSTAFRAIITNNSNGQYIKRK